MNKSITGKFLQLLERSRPARILFAASALVGAVTVLATAGRTAYRTYDSWIRWADKSGELLTSLRANVTIAEFDDRLGRPRTVTPSEHGKTTQYIYGGVDRHYWVQAVADKNGAVLMFAVTVCHERLRPSWSLWNARGGHEPVTLNETRIHDESAPTANDYYWFISGATANTYVYALYGGGNPTNYQQHAWGYNDACLDQRLDRLSDDDLGVLIANPSSEPPRGDPGDGRPITVSREMERVFGRIPANTFATFGVFSSLADLDGFQIGADRILTRTLQD